jgi:glyoxylase-like metal-dependent hydrolase (beta-lactamase superfamily II)
MRIHHLNCGTDCPFGGALFDGRSKGLTGHLVCHCLLIETGEGLVLVDTGYGLRDVDHPHRNPEPRITRTMRSLLNIKLREEETAIRQIEGLGFSPADVRHILLTHLDFDHAGGLEDFPYRPAQFNEVDKWRRYSGQGESWYGFPAVRALEGLPPEILFVPLPGHTWGHAGIAVDTGNGWLLHAGDAYFYRKEMRQAKRQCTPGLRAYQTMMEVDRSQRLANQERLRRLSVEKAGEVRILCAHDVVEFQAAAAGRLL